MNVSDNQQLYNYLLSLSSDLGNRGRKELADLILFASRHASSISTEFLGESRIALRRVLQEGGPGLSDKERDNIKNVLKQLDAALDKR